MFFDFRFLLWRLAPGQYCPELSSAIPLIESVGLYNQNEEYLKCMKIKILKRKNIKINIIEDSKTVE